MLKEKTVIIFGATGFIGYNLFLRLRNQVKGLYLVASSSKSIHGINVYTLQDLENVDFPTDTIAINVAAQRYRASNHISSKSEIILLKTKVFELKEVMVLNKKKTKELEIGDDNKVNISKL